MAYDILRLLNSAVAHGASDLHLTVNIPPTFRILGELIHAGAEVLTMEGSRDLILPLLEERQRAILNEMGEVDFAYTMQGVGRFRVNAYKQRKSLAAAIRVIRPNVPAIDELDLPQTLKELALSKNGLFLVTGHTGSGKSTTLAAMVRYINENKNCHVITIEDPIEYVHLHGKAIVNQREVHDDTNSFANALRASLREDPDVILVGEMRDLETISTAITAAETGHLVMSTLHTSSAAQTVDRIIDVFPPHQQQQIRTMLASVLTGILSQHLVQKTDGSGRVAVVELLIANDAVRNIIREGKTHQLPTVMQSGVKNNMIPLDLSLANLVRQGVITKDRALLYCDDKNIFNSYLKA